MGLSSFLVLSEDVLMDLCDLCECDKHLQRVKSEEYKGKFDISLNEDPLY